VNAASKGNIEIVEYLLKYGHANPLIKNSFGETAYDVAAISLEVYICELLEKAERDWWKGKRTMPTRMFKIFIFCSIFYPYKSLSNLIPFLSNSHFIKRTC